MGDFYGVLRCPVLLSLIHISQPVKAPEKPAAPAKAAPQPARPAEPEKQPAQPEKAAPASMPIVVTESRPRRTGLLSRLLEHFLK